jgi:hypothetical protein
MSPKQKPLGELGTVARNCDGYRADVRLSSTSRFRGPTRDSHEAAAADLRAIQAAPSRDAVAAVVKVLYAASATGPGQGDASTGQGDACGAAAGATADTGQCEGEDKRLYASKRAADATATTAKKAKTEGPGAAMAKDAGFDQEEQEGAVTGQTPGKVEELAAEEQREEEQQQRRASTPEPRAPSVFMKVLEPMWAEEVAAGQKMFECVANKKTWQNQFKEVASGDLFIVVAKGTGEVAAVGEVASPAVVKATDREALKRKLPEGRHEALDA